MLDGTGCDKDRDEGHFGADAILAGKHIIENNRPLINRHASIRFRSQQAGIPPDNRAAPKMQK